MPTKYRSIHCMLIAICSLSLLNAVLAVSICDALAYLNDPIKPDGISGAIFDNSWIVSSCDPNSRSFNFTSGVISLPSSSATLSFGSLSVLEVTVQRELQVSLSDQELISARIEVNFSLKVQGSITITLTGSVWKRVASMPLEAYSDVPTTWHGSLRSSNSVATTIVDGDLFDGVLPATISSASKKSRLNTQDEESIADVITRSLDINKRITFDAAHPTNILASIRGAFLPADALGKWTWTVISGALQGYGVGNFVHAKSQCLGADCSAVLPAIESFAQDALPACKLELLVASVSSTLTGSLFVDNTHVVLYGLHGESTATFRCDNKGVIGFVLSVTSSTPVAWDRAMYFESLRVSADLTRTNSLTASGFMFATLNVNGSLFTANRANLFESSAGGGLILPDRDLQSNDISTLFGSITQELHSSITTLDNSVSAVFAVSNIPQYVQQYSAIRRRPTFNGFLRWFCDRQTDLPTEIFSTTDNKFLLSIVFDNTDEVKLLSDSAIGLANNAMQALGDKIYARFPQISKSAFPVPTVATLQTIQHSTVRALMTADIDIDVTSGSFIVKAIKDTAATAKMRLQFSNSLFTFCNVGLDYFTEWSDVICSMNGQTQQYGLIRLDESANLIVDTPWNQPPSNLQPSLTGLAQRISNENYWTNQIMAPLPINFGYLTPDVSIASALDNIKAYLASQPASVGAVSLAQALEDTLAVLNSKRAVALTKIIANPATHTVDIILHTRQILDVAINQLDTQWHSIRTSLFNMPVLISTTLRLSLSATPQDPGYQLDVKASRVSQSRTVPFLYGMSQYIVQQSNFKLDVDLPARISFALHLEASSPNADTLAASIVAQNLVADTKSETYVPSSNAPTFSTTTNSPRFIAPENVLSALLDGILRAPGMLLQGPLNIAIPPMQNSLGFFSELDLLTSLSRSTTPWLSYMRTSTHQVLSFDVCLASLQSFTFNLTLNDRPLMQCYVQADTSSWQAFGNSVNSALANYQLDKLLRAVATLDADNPSCGRIEFYSNIAGYISSLTMDGFAGQDSSRFQAPTMAMFTSWKDLSWLVTALFGGVHVSPVWTRVKIQDIPGSIAALAVNDEKTVPAVMLDLNVNYSIATTTQRDIMDRINASFGQVVLPISGAVSTMQYDLAISCRVGAAFDIPLNANITVYSDLNGVNVTLDTLILPGNNTFTLMITAHKWNGKEREVMTSRQLITLPVGSTFQQAMLESFPAQINSTMRPMVSVSVVTLNETTFGDDTQQVLISLSTVQLPSQEYLQPVSLTVFESTVPGLLSFTNRPQTSLVIASKFSLDSSLDVSLSTVSRTNGTGFIGILDVAANHLSGGAGAELHVRQKDEVRTISGIISAFTRRELLNRTFDVDFQVRSNVTVHDLDLKVQLLPPLSDLTSLTFDIIGNWSLVDTSVFDSMVDKLSNWRLNLDNLDTQIATTLRGLMNLNATSICSWISQIESFATPLITGGLATRNLPFASSSLSRVTATTLVEALADVKDVCNNNQYTISMLCAALENNLALGYNVCRNATITDNGFSVVLQIRQLKKSFSEQLVVDSPTIFPNSGLPIMSTADGVGILEGTLDFTLPLIADFNHGVSLTIGPGRTVSVGATLNVTGSFGVMMGPLVIGFSSTTVNVGSPLTMTLADDTLTLTGEAQLQSQLNILGKHQCGLHVSIPDVASFLHGNPGSVTTSSSNCDKDIGQILKDALLESPIFNFFANPLIFTRQLTNGVDQLVRNIFSPATLGRFVVPLLDRQIELFIRQQLNGLVSPEMIKMFVTQLTNMVNGILIDSKVPLNVEALDKVVRTAVTDMLCRLLKPEQCPPVPEYERGTELKWPFVISRNPSKSVEDVNFGLGSHGIASLSFTKCDQQLTMPYTLSFTLVYSKNDGLYFTFERSPVFKAAPSFTLVGCALEGRIGFLGASVTAANSGLGGHLQIDKSGSSWSASADIGVSLKGSALLGLAGILKEANAGVTSLPYFRSDIEVGWTWTLGSSISAPTINLSGLLLCVGNSLTSEIKKVTAQADHVLKPMQPFFDILNTRLRLTEMVFGRTLTVAQFLRIIAKNYCANECEFSDTVFAALQIYENIKSLTSQLERFSVNGCAAMTSLGSFSFDFSKSNPEVTLIKPRSGGLIFDPSVPPQSQDEARQAWQRTTETPGFGVQYDLIDNIQRNLLALIQGRDIKLITINIPAFTIAVQTEWNVIIWPVPIVQLGVGIGAGITFDIGGITLTSAGIRQAIETKSPGRLINSLALPVTRSDGSRIWQLTGYLRLQGQVTVSVFIFDGRAHVFIEIRTRFGLPDRKGVGFVSFDEVFYAFNKWGFGAFDQEFALNAGFGIRIRACIPIFIGRKCWNIVNREWPFELAKIIKEGKSLDTVAFGDGRVNANVIQDGGELTLFGETPLSTQISWSGTGSTDDPSRHRNIANTIPISVTAEVHRTFNVTVRNVQQIIQFPYSRATLRLHQSSFSSGVFAISPQQVVVDGATSIQFSIGCRALVFESPVPLTSISVQGLPCPLSVETDLASNISLSGPASLYKNLPISFSGFADEIRSRIQATTYTIDAARITGDAADITTMTTGLRRETVFGHAALTSNFLVKAVPSDRHVEVVGGNGDDHFVIEELGQVGGSLMLQGGLGVNFCEITMRTTAAGLQVVSGATSIMMKQSDASNSAMWDNIIKRNFTIYGAPSATSNFTLLPVENSALVNVHSIAAPNSIFNQYITGCEQSSEVRIFLTNGGAQTVTIGRNNQISDFKCSVRVIGSDDRSQTDSIVVQASEDTKHLQWTLNSGLLRVFDRKDTSNYFFLFFENIERVSIQFSNNSTTVLNVIEGTPGTEYDFDLSSSGNNEVTVCRSTNPIRLAGNFALNVGPTYDVCGLPFDNLNSSNPFERIYGMISVVANVDAIAVSLISSDGKHPQRFFLDEQCLDPLNSTLDVINNLADVSPWMNALLQASGFNPVPNCHLSYIGTVKFIITTAAADDYFCGINAKASVSIQLNDGDDQVIWRTNDLEATANFDLGPGSDNLTLYAPLPDVSAQLGEDIDVDFVTLFRTDTLFPSIQDNVVSPIGQNNSQLSLKQYRWQDLIYIRKPLITKELLIGRASNQVHHSLSEVDFSLIQITQDNVVTINASVGGATFKYDMASNVTYDVIAVGPQSTVVLDGRGDDTSPPAVNWRVNIRQPNISLPAYVNVFGAMQTNGVTKVVSPPESIVNEANIFKVTGPINFGFVSLGGLRVQLAEVDHIKLESRSSLNVNIDGTPSNADLVIATQELSAVILRQRVDCDLLLVNCSLALSETTVAHSHSIIVAGAQSTLYHNATYLSNVTIDDGCFSPKNKSASAWFEDEVQMQDVILDSLKCALFTDYIGEMNVVSSQVTITIDTQVPARHIVIAGDLFLRDSNPWNDVIINASNIFSDNYELAIVGNNSANILVPVKSAAHFVIDCGQSTNSQVEWNIDSNTSKLMTWEGQSCRGMLPTYDLSSVSLNGTGSINFSLYFLSTEETTRDFVMQQNFFTASRISNTSSILAHVTWDSAVKVTPILDINDGHNSITIRDPLAAWHVNLNAEAQANISSDIQSAFTLANPVSFDWQTRSLSPTSGATQANCVQPAVQCSTLFWEDIRFRGNVPCQKEDELQLCSQASQLKLSTPSTIRCALENSTDTWTIQINMQLQADPQPEALFWTIYITIAVILSAAIAALYWSCHGAPILGAWIEFLIVAGLPRTVIPSEEVRHAIELAREIAINMGMGWQCDASFEHWPRLVIIILAGISLISTVLQLIWRDKARFKIVSKISSMIPLVFLLPFAIENVDSSVPSIITLVALGLLGVRYFADAYFPYKLQRHDPLRWPEDESIKLLALNIAMNFVLLGVIITATLLPKLSTDPTATLWISFALMVLTQAVFAYRAVLFVRVAHNPTAKKKQIITSAVIHFVAAVFGALFITFAVYMPDLSSQAFIAFVVIWTSISLLAVLYHLFGLADQIMPDVIIDGDIQQPLLENDGADLNRLLMQNYVHN